MPQNALNNKAILLLLIAWTAIVRGEEWRTLLDLSGEWKIQLGDNPVWADPAFDDKKWDRIAVPAPWEDQGFPGYDGYAWYRKHFTVDQSLKSKIVYLHVGYVDDVSEVYLNGHMIGFAGIFPPNFQGADRVYEKFPIPERFLNFMSDNVVAVRVYDHRLAGGIVRGRVGLYEPRGYLRPDYDLAGTWKFSTGDDDTWSAPGTNDSRWKDAIVPGYWESVPGCRNYDGFGWYRKRFTLPENLTDQTVILLLGKIDDLDEAYVNGERVGRTGNIWTGMQRSDLGTEWLEDRAYAIRPGLLLQNQENVLAVRVYDVFMHGGIYDGPVGFVTRDKYLRWKKEDQLWWRMLDWFLK